jgi:protein-tyrosine-phosphatase
VADRELAEALARARGILFLCSGNAVRSAFADIYARHRCCALPVSSAAVFYRNVALFPETARALRERGVPAGLIEGFRPRFLPDLPALPRDTLCLAMSRAHLDALSARRELGERSFLLMRLLGRDEEIEDPVLEGADWGPTFELVARCVDELVRRLA